MEWPRVRSYRTVYQRRAARGGSCRVGDRGTQAQVEWQVVTDPSPSHPSGSGVYIHIPFCGTICPYCDFAVVLDNVDHGPYLDALQASIGLDPVGKPVRSVYFGGGTPGRVDPQGIQQILAGLQPADAAAIEVTLEANVEDLSVQRLAQWRASGVNRLSIGVQRLDKPGLKALGRARSAACLDQVPDLLGQWADSGGRASVDLIYGVPGDGPDPFVRQLETVINWPIGHVSLYALTVETGTPLATAVGRGALQIATDETMAACYLGAAGLLEQAGWEFYEVSNASAPGQRSVHNSAYWQGIDCVGYGQAAVSRLGQQRFRRPAGYARYLLQPAAREEQEHLDPPTLFLEALLTGLRSFVGVPVAWLSMWRDLEPQMVNRLQDDGVFTIGPDRVSLQVPQRVRADEIAARWAAAADRSGSLPTDLPRC